MKKFLSLLVLTSLLLFGCADDASPDASTITVNVNEKDADFYYMAWNGRETEFDTETLYEITYSKSCKTDLSSCDIRVTFDKPFPSSCNGLSIIALQKDTETVKYYKKLDLNEAAQQFTLDKNTLKIHFESESEIPEDVLLVVCFRSYWNDEYSGGLYIGIMQE